MYTAFYVYHLTVVAQVVFIVVVEHEPVGGGTRLKGTGKTSLEIAFVYSAVLQRETTAKQVVCGDASPDGSDGHCHQEKQYDMS